MSTGIAPLFTVTGFNFLKMKVMRKRRDLFLTSRSKSSYLSCACFIGCGEQTGIRTESSLVAWCIQGLGWGNCLMEQISFTHLVSR